MQGHFYYGVSVKIHGISLPLCAKSARYFICEFDARAYKKHTSQNRCNVLRIKYCTSCNGIENKSFQLLFPFDYDWYLFYFNCGILVAHLSGYRIRNMLKHLKCFRYKCSHLFGNDDKRLKLLIINRIEFGV